MMPALALGLVVIIGPVPTATPATFPVQDLRIPVQQLIFPSASLDGAVTDSGDRDFRLNSDVLFAFDKADLTARARREIVRIAGLLSEGKSGKPVTKVTVTGYTDNKGSDSYNLALSDRRAQAVQAALTQALGGAGVTVTASGRGELDPIATNKTEHGQALNRRVEIRGS